MQGVVSISITRTLFAENITDATLIVSLGYQIFGHICVVIGGQ